MRSKHDHLPRRLLVGQEERIFDVLPQSVLANLYHAASENALLWNLIYPLAQPTLSLAALLSLRPLWGTAALQADEDDLRPYYWGYSVDGERLPGLDQALDSVDGPGPRTEVDLFLVGETNLVLVEAKHMSGPGRCSRYGSGRCPEVHVEEVGAQESCRYWELPSSRFDRLLELGERPQPDDTAPPCNRHYQLARTLTLGATLAAEHGLDLHLWMITPRSRWASLQKSWLDFAERVREDSVWRRMRVLSWETIAGLPTH
ncbi:MAG: hypothetical protein PVF70_14375 [Anaerolineales bacterium]